MSEQEKQEQQTSPSQTAQPAWKKVVAVIIDLAISFFGFGFIVAAIFGQTTPEGFDLQGGPAILFFITIGLYFYLGYGVWKKSIGLLVMGIAKK